MVAEFSVKVGTLNTTGSNYDGSGNAEYLDDSYEILSEQDVTGDSEITTNEEKVIDDDTANATYQIIESGNDMITVIADDWNADSQKELRIDASNVDVQVSDFVDIDINLESSYTDLTIEVNNSKRGEVSTGSGDDNILIALETNKASAYGWGNDISVDSGHGNDSIYLTDNQNSQYTSYQIDAGSGNDTINVSDVAKNDNADDSAYERSIDAGSGNDTVYGSDGNEYIIGGDGQDTIYAGDGLNIIDGGNDHDIIYGGSDIDIIDGGNGDDIIYTGEGYNTVDAGSGKDTIYGGDEDDYIDGGHNADTIYAGDGNNTVLGGSGNDLIYAGSNEDYIDGGHGSDVIYAGAGNDTIIFDKQDSLVDAGEGFDALIVSDGWSRIDSDDFINFEAIIAEASTDNKVVTGISDGLIVSLGADAGDTLSFDENTSFTLDSDAALNSEQVDSLADNGVDASSLTAYLDTVSGYTVWSDIDLTA